MKVDSSKEKEIRPFSGMAALLLALLFMIGGIAAAVLSVVFLNEAVFGIGLAAGILLVLVGIFMLPGLRAVAPKEALVLVLFGNYYGTIRKEGFYFVNPFCTAVNPTVKGLQASAAGSSGLSISGGGSRKVSLKTMTLNNEKQKVNDQLGNPVIIGAVVIWRVVDPTKAVFQVNNYKTFLSIQCDSVIRNVARLYPYDAGDEENGGAADEKTLRGSTREVAEKMRAELQARVAEAGLEVSDVQITHLSYAPEIASAMLQRQQAVAIIAARQKIVEGAVGMVEMALDKLSEQEVVELDEERKAAMVSNLLVVLCGNKEAQPIVNSGSIY